MLMFEQWVDIKGYEDYQVSEFGSVRRKERQVRSVVPQHKGFRILREKMCAITDNGRGYKLVSFKINGLRKNHYVHRLVAENFLQNPNNLSQVNHIDGNKANNAVWNLEWVTNQQNRDHATRNGLIAYGESNGLAKMTLNQVKEIKEIFKKNPLANKTHIGKHYGVSCTAIIKILKGQRWSKAIKDGHSVSRISNLKP